jgi:predicted nuclease of predicted toxin-antitoxin system
MRIRFQADADLDGRVIRGLRRVTPEIDICSAADVGLAALDDIQVLRLSAAEGRILISQDRRTMPGHFHRFVKSCTSSPGVILLREGTSIATAIDELSLLWAASEAGEWTNRLLWIPL